MDASKKIFDVVDTTPYEEYVLFIKICLFLDILSGFRIAERSLLS